MRLGDVFALDPTYRKALDAFVEQQIDQSHNELEAAPDMNTVTRAQLRIELARAMRQEAIDATTKKERRRG